MMFLKALPFVFVYSAVIGGLGAALNGSGGEWVVALVNFLLGLFALPILAMNFLNKETVGSFFEFKIVQSVFSHLGDYLIVLLKSILLGIVFMLMWIVLVGIPAGSFTKNIFLADFYRRRVK